MFFFETYPINLGLKDMIITSNQIYSRAQNSTYGYYISPM